VVDAWDYPVFIIATVIAGIAIAAWLFRVGAPLSREPTLVCDLCGRKQRGLYVREWRFCPYCGTPRKRERSRY
jgi:rRNA maturation endonuclease Nob1